MLLLLTFLPLLGAVTIALTPASAVSMQRNLALFWTLLVAGMGLAVFTGFDGALDTVQREANHDWFSLPGTGIDVHLRLGVDGLSILMAVFTAVLMPFVVLCSKGHVTERVKEFLVWLLVMQTGMLGVFLALDLVLFYFFWEVSLVPLYFIVGIWGGEERLYATLKFFLYTLAGSLVMLVGLLFLLYGAGTSDFHALLDYTAELPLATQGWIFGSFALAFAIKVPVLPFHTWLADAHTQAPTSGSVLLAGVLLKMGTYGLLRFGIQLFPAAAVEWGWIFMALGAIGIVYGALLAMAQTDLKRLIACSSVSHLGFVVLGMFALTQAGLRGGILQMVNHGLSTGLLFLLVGMVYERRHSRRIDHYGGLASTMPLFAIFFVFTVLSSVGLPGLNGFVGEYMILFGAFEAAPFWAVIGTTGVILGAIYLLSATRRVLFGAVVHEENRKLGDLKAGEMMILAPLCALCVWIGVRPAPFLSTMDGSVDALVQRIEEAREGLAVSQADAPAGVVAPLEDR